MGARSGQQPVNSLVPIMASGTATVFKLLVATLALGGAYVGVTATHQAAGHPEGARVATAPGGGTAERLTAVPGGGTGTGTPVRTVVLSARSMPVEAERAPRTGVVTVASSAASGSCARTYHAQSVVASGGGGPAVYAWRLTRWSAAAHAWQPYLYSGTAGFLGRARTVEWYPRVMDNPGWYRAELTVSGKSAVTSEKFQITC